MSKVGPHEWQSAKLPPWICLRCYAPKSLHPRKDWVVARKLGDHTYLSKDAPHFKDGW